MGTGSKGGACAVRFCVALATETGFCSVHTRNRGYEASRDTGSQRRKPDTLQQPDMVQELPAESGVWRPGGRQW